MTGFSTAVVAQNLRRMVARGDLREQQLPGGQLGYATSPVDPDAARSSMDGGIQGGGAETGRASDPVTAEIANAPGAHSCDPPLRTGR